MDHEGMPFPLNIIGMGQAHQEAHRKAEMEMNDNQAAVLDLMNNLGREELKTLRTVVTSCQNEFISGMMYGLIVGITAQRFDTNFEGQTMEEQLAAEQLVREAEARRDEPEWKWPNPMDKVKSYMEENYPTNTHNPKTGEELTAEDGDADTAMQLELFPAVRADGYPIEEVSVEEVEASMKRFKLRASENPGRFICSGCGLEYVSLADRALRDDCHGCAARAAQG